jgi:hypothetical protein
MRATRAATILAAVYLTVAALCIGYELSIRLFDRGNSEFAGMLCALPHSIRGTWVACRKELTGD